MTAIPATPSAHDGSLLLYCLGIRQGDGGISPPPITVPECLEVLRQAFENDVATLLYHRLRTAAPAPPLPPPALDVLQAAALRSAAQSLRISRELAELLELLRRQGIPVIVLKGGHLGHAVYQSFALRTMCDLDLMVCREDLARAGTALAGCGYAPQYYGVEEVDYAHHHHLRPMARPGGIRVEIHWNLARPSSPFDIDLEGIWQRARREELGGAEAIVLSIEDLLLHLCIHASFVHKFRVGLRACWDIREVVQRHRDAIDWDVVVRRAQQWRAGRYVYLTLRLVRELLAADIPAATLGALEPPAFPAEVLDWARTSIFAPETDAAVSPSMARLWTSGRVQAMLNVLRTILYPPRTTMARIYRTPPGSRLIYLYYPVRWADLLVRYGRHAWGLWRGDHRTHDELRAVSKRAALRDWLRSAP